MIFPVKFVNQKTGVAKEVRIPVQSITVQPTSVIIDDYFRCYGKEKKCRQRIIFSTYVATDTSDKN